MFGASVISIDMGVFQLSLFRGSILLISLIMILNLLLKNKKIHLNMKKANSYSIKFMFVWFIYAFFTLAWAKDYIGWIKALFFIGLGVLCIIIYSKYIKSNEDILKSFRVIFPTIIFHNILGWYEAITGHYLFLSEERIVRYLRYGHPVSTFGNTNDFAVFLMFSFFVLYVCLMNSRKFVAKLIYTLTMISSVALLISTGSRAALIGLIMGVMTIAFYSIQRKQIRRIVVSFLLAMSFVIIINPDVVLELFSSILNFDFSQQSGSEYVRINLIKNGFSFFISTLGLGTGAGNIEYWMANYGKYNTGGVLNIHNWWMEILVGYGLIIFVLYIIFYSRLFYSMRFKFKTSTNRQDLTISLGIMSTMIGYIVASISSSSNMSAEWLWVFWAIVIAYQGVDVENQRHQR
jgi:teichuronic acid biosynthesis protein TuaE